MGLRIQPVLLVLLILIRCTITYGQPKKVIFDTDMGPDYDDVGAITVLHQFADRGKVEILATIASTRYDGVASVLNVFNTYFQRPSIPIAVTSEHGLTLRDSQHWTDSIIAKYPHAIRSNSGLPSAVNLYRKMLAGAKDTSITIITVGFFTNIADLLRSAPDDISPLNGADLVAKKVKSMVSMAGKFPAGKEFNVDRDPPSSQYVMINFPRPLYLSGFEIGEKIFTGIPLVNNNNIRNSPVRDVFRICTAMSDEDRNGRKSWDQTAVLIGIADIDPYYTIEQGRMIVADDGSNTWNTRGRGHYRIIEKMPVLEVTKVIDELMMR